MIPLTTPWFPVFLVLMAISAFVYWMYLRTHPPNKWVYALVVFYAPFRLWSALYWIIGALGIYRDYPGAEGVSIKILIEGVVLLVGLVGAMYFGFYNKAYATAASLDSATVVL